MSFCPKCGAPLSDDSKFCTNCGAAVGTQNNQNQYQQNGYQQGGSYYGNPVRPVSFGQKNIGIAIVLSIVTFGIYYIIWYVNVIDDLNEAADEPSATSGITVFLLSLVTCGIYMLYWLYKSGDKINKAKAMRALGTDPNAGLVYMLFALFGFAIVSFALLQNELNKIAEYHGAPRP